VTNINLINEHIQKRLLTERKNEVTAIEAAVWLDTAGVLSDSQVRRGLPLRRLLREKLIAGQMGLSSFLCN
jgi:hypothetical protein